MGLSVLPSSKSRLLTCLIGNKELLCTQCRGIWPHLSASSKSHGFSRVAVGVAIKNFFCSSTSGLLSSYDVHLMNLNYAELDNTDASGGEAGDRGSLSSWNSDFGIPIHFQE